ncbi:MAG TPA: alcohol dehydrogenase catalytic domain-containing protein [Blastocatellia bacterium]|nr:alcohol dehydrogenase catalytic domain-containing protein [Blastocatellia bacterium]
MKALRFDGKLELARDEPVPRRGGEALVQVIAAGLCSTDREITRGYAGFRGIPGHEFVGRVIESPEPELIGKRVVGEINVGCAACELCRRGDSRHCANRTVLGIKGRDGAFAEFLSLPPRNLLSIPDSISDEAAVFIEPLAAALHVLDDVDINRSSRVIVIGDGKLAQLILRAIVATGCSPVVIGKHAEKLLLAGSAGARPILESDLAKQFVGNEEKADVVIEASGSPSGLSLALDQVRPRGVIVLKSTHHSPTPVDFSRAVVNEVVIRGSRCGRFAPAIDLLASGSLDVAPLISARFPLEDGLAAFQKAFEPGALKTLLDVTPGA